MKTRFQPTAFTIRSRKGTLKALITNCRVSEPFEPEKLAGKAPPEIRDYKGLWDTGATGSVITEKVVKELGLSATGRTIAHDASGEKRVSTYLINLFLPNHVMIAGVRVTEGVLNGFDVLIGMDVISQGDFAVTNLGGKTVFSFRMPSMAEFDFVHEIEQAKANPANPEPKKNKSSLSSVIHDALEKK